MDRGNPYKRQILPSILSRRLAAICLFLMLALASASAQTESILYSFSANPDGALPNAGPVFDSAGNLYGTTPSGGAFGNGAIFEFSAAGVESVLYSFTGGNDGDTPYGALIIN